jgi:methylphosphotriester-DNA--protein-cysteine methyltransferase
LLQTYQVLVRPLSAYVEYLWVAEGYLQPHARELVLPTASLTLVIDLDFEKRDDILISGARSEPLLLGTAKPLRIMSAVFKPGCGFPFAKCPAGELQNLQVPLSAFWPAETAALREQLLEAGTNSERFRVLERFLMRRLRASRQHHLPIQYALRQLQAGGRACSVANVREQIGMSAERFIEMFRKEVGLPPKLFARLARFRRVLKRIDTHPDIDWADLAVSAGYFDQPHFVRDFRQFAGVTPSAFLRDRTARNHVRIPD